MNQTSIERLRDYLGQLPPGAQSLLMREFERAIERGEDVAVASFVLAQLRMVVRGPERSQAPREESAARLVFRALEPFLIDASATQRPGQIRRTSLDQVWQWMARDGIRSEIAELETLLASQSSEAQRDQGVRKVQLDAAAALKRVLTSGDRRALATIGPPSVAEDLAPIGAVLEFCDALHAFATQMPNYLRTFESSQVVSASSALNVPELQAPDVVPFALALLMQRLTSPWQIIRLGVHMAQSDNEARVAGTPYGVAVTMALHDLARLASALRDNMKRGELDNIVRDLKTLHDGIRGLRTELDLRADSTWGKRLAAIRVEISNALQSEIDSVPGRVRRLLRQRPDKDVTASTRLDSSEVEETAALIALVGVCRGYASELALNEVALRAYSDLQNYVESATERLVDALRVGDPKGQAFRDDQVKAAIRFCDAQFGPEYAALMEKAAGVARTGERNSRAG